MLFPSSFRDRFDNQGSLATIEVALPALAALRIDELDGIALSPVTTLPSRIAILMQAGLRRSLELSGLAAGEMVAEHVVNACLLIRGTFETACLLSDVASKAEALVASGKTEGVQGFSKYVSDTLFGHGPKAKTFVIIEQHVVQNIMTVIQRLSKRCEAIEGFYEALCEYSHPNCMGMLAVYTEPGPRTVIRFVDGEEKRKEVALLAAGAAFALALGLIQEAHATWTRVAKSFAILTERKSFEEGSWPTLIPYPVQRDSHD